MRKFTSKVLAATAIVFLAGAPHTTTASADDHNFSTSSGLMSYAPQLGFDKGRFGQFDFTYSEHEDDHELNDAWLGLSAYSNDGTYVGYIEDAILDENGFVTELVIGTPDGNTAVQLDADYAELLDDKVNLEITQYEFVSILTGGQVVSSLSLQ